MQSSQHDANVISRHQCYSIVKKIPIYQLVLKNHNKGTHSIVRFKQKEKSLGKCKVKKNP